MIELPWSAAEIVTIFAVMSLGATVQGSIGFGQNLLAAPVLLLIDPMLVPGPILVAAVVLGILLVRRERSSLDLSGLGWATVGRVPGTVVGIAALGALPQSELTMTLGVLVILAAAISASGLRMTPNRSSLAVAGAASGFMSATCSIGGPPMALVYQESRGGVLRATLNGHFIFGATFSIVLLALSGHFASAEVTGSLLLIPGVIVGYALSGVTAPILDRGYLRPAVLAVSAVGGIAVVVRELM